VGRLAERAPGAVGWGLAAAQAFAEGPQELAVVGGGPEDAAGLAAAARRLGRAGLVLAIADTGIQPGAAAGDGRDAGGRTVVPLLEGRTPADSGGPRAYLCRQMVCLRPVESADELMELLRST
jgi:uncharacterized protein YyaL (SSP411 family)